MRWIWGFEYYSPQTVEVRYRNQQGFVGGKMDYARRSIWIILRTCNWSRTEQIPYLESENVDSMFCCQEEITVPPAPCVQKGSRNQSQAMKLVAIIQARMGSSRWLPGKVLMDLGGETVLAGVFERLKLSLIDRDCEADRGGYNYVLPADDAIVAESRTPEGLACFRGSEHDVLDRYYRAARAYLAESVVRVTSGLSTDRSAVLVDGNRILRLKTQTKPTMPATC